jgi:hypothetical protein
MARSSRWFFSFLELSSCGRIYGTQALPRHPLRAVYLILFNLNIIYKLAFERILQNLNVKRFY